MPNYAITVTTKQVFQTAADTEQDAVDMALLGELVPEKEEVTHEVTVQEGCVCVPLGEQYCGRGTAGRASGEYWVCIRPRGHGGDHVACRNGSTNPIDHRLFTWTNP